MTEGTTVRHGWLVVSLLCLLYVVAFIDRLILALLVQPLKASFDVSDFQIALLFGTAFALVFGGFGLPLGRLADRMNRHKLIVFGAVVWTVCTILSAFAPNFATLVLLRGGLAFGEAALIPAGYSLIADLYENETKRRSASSFFAASGTLGASCSFIVGGMILTAIASMTAGGRAFGFQPWQAVLISVGVPGLVLALVFAVFAKEPARRDRTEKHSHPSLADLFAHVRQNVGVFAGMFGGTALLFVAVYSATAWVPELLVRSYGVPISRAGFLFGLVLMFAGPVGSIVVPWFVKTVGARWLNTAIIQSAVAVVGGAILIIGYLQSDATIFLVLFALGALLIIGLSSDGIISIQMLAPDRMRATLVAAIVFLNILVGLGVGPAGAAAVMANAPVQYQTLNVALSVMALLGTLSSALFFMLAGLSFSKDRSKLGVGALVSQ
ncbi:MFS family permease [Bradyrhizobium sp. USDA 4011]